MANGRWKQNGSVFGDRAGVEFLGDPVGWVVKVPFIRPSNAGGAVIGDIVIGAIEVPQKCEESISYKDKGQRNPRSILAE